MGHEIAFSSIIGPVSSQYDSFEFNVSPQVIALGIRGICFAATNLQNSASSPEFEALAAPILREIASNPDDSQTDPILAEFRRLHQDVGAHPKKDVASPQTLLKIVRRSGQLPKINLLVDIYNLVSVETRLSLGAHDLSRITGNVTLRLTEGTERFVPLGMTDPIPVRKGEYCYIDDAPDILCRLEVRQADKTKTGPETRDAMIMIQGNRATNAACIQACYERLTSLIQKFCGGEFRELWKSEAE
jgi:DNA/RNA-binding domain of Phe-tRNA-synthetase-like protein